MLLRFIHVLCVINSSFLVLLDSSSLCGCNATFIHSPVDGYLDCFYFFTFSFCEHLCSSLHVSADILFLMEKYLGIKLLGKGISICFILWEITNLSPAVVLPFSFPPGKIQGCQMGGFIPSQPGLTWLVSLLCAPQSSSSHRPLLAPALVSSTWKFNFLLLKPSYIILIVFL